MIQEAVLPDPKTYEEEMKYFPWGQLIDQVAEYVIKNAPQNGRAIDLMCGPGYLMGLIKERRPDLDVWGFDINEGFLDHAHQHYPNVHLILADILKSEIVVPFDVVICTGGLHHLPYDKQPELLVKICNAMKDDGFAIIADPCIGPYWGEQLRRCKAVELGSEYLIATIRNKAPDDVLKAAVDIIANDVLGYEYKNSARNLWQMLNDYFELYRVRRIWPPKNPFERNMERDVVIKSDTSLPFGEGYGDYVFVVKKRHEEE
jgi:ubiquinone/menaquinone biosynthesis C-methylase UbiE